AWSVVGSAMASVVFERVRLVIVCVLATSVTGTLCWSITVDAPPAPSDMVSTKLAAPGTSVPTPFAFEALVVNVIWHEPFGTAPASRAGGGARCRRGRQLRRVGASAGGDENRRDGEEPALRASIRSRHGGLFPRERWRCSSSVLSLHSESSRQTRHAEPTWPSNLGLPQ